MEREDDWKVLLGVGLFAITLFIFSIDAMQKTYRHNPAVKDIFSVAGGGMGTVNTRPNTVEHR
jgi:hypothetical protein